MAKKLPIMPENMQRRVEAAEMGVPLNNPISKQESSEMMLSTKSIVPDMPTQYKRIISLCPIAKVLQPYVDVEPYLEEPGRVFNNEPFDIIVEGAAATRKFAFGEVYMVKDSEAEVLVGSSNQRFERSTGYTGFVFFEAPPDMIAAYEYAKKTKKAIDPDLKKELDVYIKQATELSRKRVIDTLKTNYNTIMMSRQTMKEAGSSQGTPNDHEYLMTFILEEDIKRKVDIRQKFRKKYEEAQATINGKDDFTM